MTTLYIHRPPIIGFKITESYCPICKADRPFLAEHFEWQEPTLTCLYCGDVWHGEELTERSHSRYWRKESMEHANARIEKYEKSGMKSGEIDWSFLDNV